VGAPCPGRVDPGVVLLHRLALRRRLAADDQVIQLTDFQTGRFGVNELLHVLGELGGSPANRTCKAPPRQRHGYYVEASTAPRWAACGPRRVKAESAARTPLPALSPAFYPRLPAFVARLGVEAATQ
jgi:hypothetical protein